MYSGLSKPSLMRLPAMIWSVQCCPHVRAAGSKGSNEKIAKTTADTTKSVMSAKKARRATKLSISTPSILAKNVLQVNTPDTDRNQCQEYFTSNFLYFLHQKSEISY
ncbi:unannotated protein [freshwater metagenome]|uniref:Unannotated protein n=1 Tax=freshwater metagenome TaxID=449393 RepID=A0A6J7U875_9ZZZZ